MSVDVELNAHTKDVTWARCLVGLVSRQDQRASRFGMFPHQVVLLRDTSGLEAEHREKFTKQAVCQLSCNTHLQ